MSQKSPHELLARMARGQAGPRPRQKHKWHASVLRRTELPGLIMTLKSSPATPLAADAPIFFRARQYKSRQWGSEPRGADPRSGLRGCKVPPGHGARFAPSEIQEIHIFGQELHNSGKAEISRPKFLIAPRALILHTRVHPHALMQCGWRCHPRVCTACGAV